MNLKTPHFWAVPLLALSAEALHILSPERYILQKVKFLISFVKIHFDAEPKCLTLYRMLVKRKLQIEEVDQEENIPISVPPRCSIIVPPRCSNLETHHTSVKRKK